MRPIGTFTVSPLLPERLEGLRELAYNLRWAWDHATIELFRRLDSGFWERTGHNPVLMLGMIDQRPLEAAAEGASTLERRFLGHAEGAAG